MYPTQKIFLENQAEYIKMQFIKKDKSGTWQMQRYFEYLDKIGNKLPQNARNFAFFEGHYDITHPQCPHDSWVEFVNVHEISQGKRNEIRHIEINAKFLDARHEGFFEITYKNVQSYNMSLASSVKAVPYDYAPAKIGHGDWIVDEITINPSGHVLHEIEFSDSAVWKILCNDIVYKWWSAPQISPT